MELANPKVKLAAIATGTVLLLTGLGLFLYWQVGRRAWCVRTVSISSHEVTYSWGCVHPQRYRQWSITASGTPAKPPSSALDAVSLNVDRLQTIHRDI
jgi:hypothetical protein